MRTMSLSASISGKRSMKVMKDERNLVKVEKELSRHI